MPLLKNQSKRLITISEKTKDEKGKTVLKKVKLLPAGEPALVSESAVKTKFVQTLLDSADLALVTPAKEASAAKA